MNEFWQTCVQRLEQELPPQQISAWIRPLVPLAFDDEQALLRVSAPNRFKLDWVRKNFSNRIEDLASEWFDRPVQVAFELANAAGAAPSLADRRAPESARPVAGGAGSPRTGAPAVNPAAAATAAVANATAAELAYERSRLNAELTFDNFVTGKANQLGRAAAMQVA